MSSKPSPKDSGLIDRDTLCKELEEYRQLGYESVGFLGGDFSIHPQLFPILSYAKQLGYTSINITTNAMVFDSHEKSKRLIESGVTRINISIHSHKPDIEDALTQIPGGLKRKLQAIQNFNQLRQSGLQFDPLSINFVLNKKNYSSLAESCLFFYKVFQIRDMRINFVWPTYDLGENMQKIAVSYTEIKPCIQKIVALAIKHDIRITFDTIPPCILRDIFPENSKAIIERFSGEQFDTINEINSLGLHKKFLWKKRKREKLKYQGIQCSKCLYESTCDGPWREYVELFGFQEFTPIKK